MSRRRGVAPCVLLIVFLACGDGRLTDPSDRDAVQLVVVVDLSRHPAVTDLVVEVDAPDIDPALTFNLATVDGVASGTIIVPAGASRRITVRAFDGAGIETHRGAVTVDIVAGENSPLAITLVGLVGELPIEVQISSFTLAVSPEGDTVLVGDSLRFAAFVIAESGDTLDAQVHWATANPSVATVDSTGLAVTVGPGTATIVATYAGRAGIASMTVLAISVSMTVDSMPFVVTLDVDVQPAAPVAVEYWAADAPRLRIASPAAASHRLLLARLLAETAYAFTLTVGDPAVSAVTDSFVTDTLPDDLEAVGLTSTGASTAPLVMLELRVPTFQGFAAVDSVGRPVWFHRTDGSSWGWTRRANGNFVFLDTGDGLTEVTPADAVVANLLRAGGEVIHHDVIATPENTLYFMTRHPETVDGTTWVGERVWEWNPDTDALTVRWNAFDFLSPATDTTALSRTSDWLHTNAVSIGVSGNVLVSSAFLNQVLALTPDFSAIAWRLGGPNASLVPDSAATFAFQHTAAEVAEGRVVVFDNRGATAGGAPVSRALEVALDFEAGTATTAWSFVPPNGNYAAIISSARRMPNGNTMVAFGPGEGVAGSVGPIEVYEVTPAGEIVWHLLVEGPNHMYRATPFTDIAGETRVPE